MSNFFCKTIEETAEELQVNTAKGLTEPEVSQRIKTYGENKLAAKASKTIFQMFIAQFKDFLVIILIIAAILSIGLEEYLEGFIILAIVILNACLGVFQENKASNALKALKEMASPLAKVLRNGQILSIASNEVVPGDIILLEAGDYVPADARLIESINLKIDEAALTGESVPSEKHVERNVDEKAGIGDHVNSAFMGTVVTYGRGKAIVTHTGMNTQMGKIATMLNESDDENTPLQTKLDSLGKLLGVICIIVCVVIFALGLWYKMDIMEIFITAVSLAVAAIPEGLTVVVTVILAIGMQKMVKTNAIVKRLSAVETLGSTTVICSDKTGTLTQNKMTVVKLFDTENFYEVTGTGYGANGEILNDKSEKVTLNHSIQKLIEGAVLCNDASYSKTEEKIVGDPTEGALLVIGEKVGIGKKEYNDKYTRINEIPFDSDRKLMSTFHNIDGKIVMYTKGAPDEILRRSTFVYKNGEVLPLSDEQKKLILDANRSYAESALRVLGVAFRTVNSADTSDVAESELTFIGLLGMIDPPREEAREAIKTCKRAGITVKMITGDHKITASAIGRQLGILDENGESLEGRELDLLSDKDLQDKVRTVNVFARVSPEHKVRLITAVKANGNIAAMTGDGVNDAPSLKKADIGIAMGITGTDVSKEASDMILTDDNFATIVKAVEEGRTIYNNIRKVVAYLLSCNLGEILIILIAMILNIGVPLVPIQLLSINLITDAFPAFALGMEEKEDGIMDNPPRNPEESIVNKNMQIMVAFQSIFLTAGALGSYLYAKTFVGVETATCFCFITLVVGELLKAYSLRSEHTSIFKMKLLSNSFLNKSVIFSLLFLFVAVYVPFLNEIFSTVPLSITNFGIAVLFAFLPLIGSELSKKF